MIATYYRIDLREIPKKYWDEESGLVKVVRNSPILLRKEVEHLAYYFRGEFRYDFVQFGANDDTEYTAYLFANERRRHPRVWVGACCFRTRNPKDIGFPFQALQWIWIHPYFRSRGLLTTHWPTLKKNHGDFYTEPPISSGMCGFLLKCNSDSAFLPMYKRQEMTDAEIKEMFVRSMKAEAARGEHHGDR